MVKSKPKRKGAKRRPKEVILQITEEPQAELSRQLKKQFDAAHADGMAALKAHKFDEMKLAIDREKAIIEALPRPKTNVDVTSRKKKGRA